MGETESIRPELLAILERARRFATAQKNLRSSEPSTTPRSSASEKPEKPLEAPKAIDYVSQIRGQYEVSTEELTRNAEAIVSWEKLQAKCKGCRGETCQQRDEYMIPIVEGVNGQLHQYFQRCKWGRKKMAEERAKRLFKNSKVPEIYKGATLYQYRINQRNEQAVKAAKEIAHGKVTEGLFAKPPGLYIHGPRGTGKTLLASILANALMRDGKAVLFESVPDFLNEIRRSYKEQTTEAVTEAARTVEYLFLDDIGAERTSAWVEEQLFSLLNHRMNERLPTIITSNYDVPDLADHLSPDDGEGGLRIASRVSGMCEVVEIGGEDWRMK